MPGPGSGLFALLCARNAAQHGRVGFETRRGDRLAAGDAVAVLAALEPFEPRPHWGKLFAMGDLSARFPRLPDFLDLARRYDPDGKLWNPFLDRLLD